MNTATPTASASAGKAWTIGLWAVQILLAAMYGFAGFNKLAQSSDALVAMGMAWVASSPIALVRFIGLAEVAGALGMILPWATRIMPRWTPLAALGLCAIQVLAMPVHIFRGEYGVLPINLMLFAMALFVWWGRSRRLRGGASAE